MINLAIFENEFKEIKETFNLLNIIHFDEKLTYKVFQTSQDFEMKKIKEFDIFFVDIDLSLRSNKDGISLIQELYENKSNIKIIIITGSSNIKEKLSLKGIEKVQIVDKPLDIDELKEAINKELKS